MKQNIYDNPEFFEGYRQLRETGSGLNEDIEEPAVRSVLPDPNGLRVLDIGCGAGRLCRYLADRGAASTLGTDISEMMLTEAQKASQGYESKIEYRCSALEDLVLDSARFDLIVSSLALHYVEDLHATMRKIAGWLDSNGTLVFSTEHPVMTAHKEQAAWHSDGETKLHWPLDHYQAEGIRSLHWFVDGVIKYHRTMATIVNSVIDAGLTIERMIEPQAAGEAVKRRPELVHESRRPCFVFIRARKIGR